MQMTETVPQSMIDSLFEVGRGHGMEINVEKTKTVRISRQPAPLQIKVDKKPVENMEEFNYLGTMITNDARCAREIKASIAMAKAAAFNKKTLFTSKLDLELRKKLVKCYIWSIALYGEETWTLRKLEQKYLESLEMWCWRRMEKISWTDRVNNEAVLHRVKEERNFLHTIRRRKANWIGRILVRNCLLSHIIEGKIKGTRRRGRRLKQLLDDMKEARRYWKLKEEAQDRTLWRTHCQFGRGYATVARYTTT
jgi:hypothetical protein